MVWKRQGEWHLNGSSSRLRLGEGIPPGGLLTAGGEGAPHSIVILLPDGQRLLCECYEAETCAQGFRVPVITSQPSADVWTMFAAVRNVLLFRPDTAEAPFPAPAGRDIAAANVEIVSALGARGELSIAPALRVLPAGRYSLEVRWDGAQPGANPSVQPLDWKAAPTTAQVRVSGLGLYRITVWDDIHVPRMEIEVLATSPATSDSETDRLKKVRLTVIEWNRIHEGWSLHDFLRVYLQSRALRAG